MHLGDAAGQRICCMYIGSDPSANRFGERPRALTICDVAAASPDRSEAFIGNGIRALRALGHTVVPVVLGPRAAILNATAVAGEPPPADVAIRLDEVETLAALTRAAANPAGLAAAVGFAQLHRGSHRRTLLRAAARLAHVAQAEGCTHLHAHFAQSAAAVAICAARIAGVTASFTVHSADMAPGTETNWADLALKLAATDLVVALSAPIAAEARRLAPHANVRQIPVGVEGYSLRQQTVRLAAAFMELRKPSA
jgi:colanic acid/amylovoran biosynthesis glycosyltransferase